MHIEIEAKLKVDSLKKVARRLKARDAKFLRGAVHTDAYFDDAKKSLRKSDSALRIRRQVMDRGEPRHPGVITFKGPRRKGFFKQRQEIQFGISDADIAEMFLVAIGYKKTLVYQKKRQVWRLGGCEVALDELPLLGTFVEIEGPSEKKIAAVQKKLGLEDLPHIPESYAALMQKQIRRRGRKSNRVFF
jgi:adenylate cyclase class 2